MKEAEAKRDEEEASGHPGYAVELLKKHVSVDHVAMLLADDPDTVKRHYYPWVPELQDLLGKEVKCAWDEDAPIILADVDKALQGTVGQA